MLVLLLALPLCHYPPTCGAQHSVALPLAQGQLERDGQRGKPHMLDVLHVTTLYLVECVREHLRCNTFCTLEKVVTL